jgi:hypothetical protein
MTTTHGIMRNRQDVLQAIVEHGFVKTWDLPDLSGYPKGTSSSATCYLRRLGLVEVRAGFWVATERGKIALAIIFGKQARRRQQVLRRVAT